jgi:hypothetical protein
MNENNISVDCTSVRTGDEHKSTDSSIDQLQDVVQRACSNPPNALSLYQTLTDNPPSKVSVEDELGHLHSHIAEVNPNIGNPKRKVERIKPTLQSVSKKLWYELDNDQPITATGLKRNCPSSKSGPKSAKLYKPKESLQENLIPKVEECDLMPALGINELRRKYKVTIAQNMCK